MNDILNEQAKSFRIIRPKTKTGSYKPMVTYTKKSDGCIFFSLSETTDELFNGLRNLFGEKGATRSFIRFYYPKRLIYTSTLYPKPRVFKFIDEKEKKNMVFRELKGFRGQPKNKLIDKRNCILDFSDVMPMVIPKDKHIMIRSGVFNYIENIYPEFLCYVLFDNPKHDKKNDIEIEEGTEAYNPKFTLTRYDLDTEWKEDIDDKSFEELSKIESTEAFTEKLMAKTKIFSMSGPMNGIDKYGFDKFIISIPMYLTNFKLMNIPYISGKLPILRPIKLNPDLIYTFSFLRLINKIYEAYFTGSTDNEFIRTMISHNITFHLYARNGTGFCMNLKELRDNLKYKPIRFLRTFINRLQMLTMLNTGSLTDTDIDRIELEEDKKEDELLAEITSGYKSDVTISFKNTMKNTLNSDVAMKTLIMNKKEKIEEVVKEEIVDVMGKVSGKVVSATKIAANQLADITNKFLVDKTVSSIVSHTDDAIPIVLSNTDIDDILNENDSETEEIVEEEVTEEVEDIEITEDTINEIVEEERDETLNDDYYGAFEDELQEVDEEIVNEDEEEGYVTITPGNKNGPVKLTSENKKEPLRTKAEQRRINVLKEKYKSLEIDGNSIEDIIGNSANIDITDSFSLKDKKISVKDKNVKNLSLSNFEKSYIDNNYQSDIVNAVRSLSINKERPLYMTKANIEDTSDQFTNKITYSFVLEDEYKKKHNLKFDIPKISENGTLKIGGSEKYIKKQLIRKPIVKIGPDKVYITTQFNNFQISRAGLILNKSSEIIRRLLSEYFVDNTELFIERGDCTEDNTDYTTTLEYDSLAKNYFMIKIRDEKAKYGEHIEIHFSQKVIRNRIKKYNLNTGFEGNIIPDNYLPIAINYTKHIVYSIDTKLNGSVNSTIYSIFLNAFKDPGLTEFVHKIKVPKRRVATKVEIQSWVVPLIAFCNYTFGWDRVKSYFPENEIEFSEKRINNTQKLSLRFYDGYLYYKQYPINGAIFLNGLTEIDTENYKYEDLNNPAMYINYTQNKFKTRNIVKGWVTARESMLDFKTLQILEALELPTDMLEIFLYCNDLLVDNQVKPESDISNYRLRNNEIISECLYKALNDQYTIFKKRSGKRITMTIPQNVVMSKINKLDILENYNCLSPVSEIRGTSSATFKGPGGTKLKQAFTVQKRAYNKSYFGTFGISTPDNESAGVVKELTLNAKITNTLGFIGKQDPKNFSLNDISTISEALVPFANNIDDPSRIAFISGQNNHVGGLLNSSLPCVRTGVEKTVHAQCGENFVKKAKKDGVVTDIDEVAKKIYITYKDKSKEVIDYNNLMLKNSDAFNESEFTAFVKQGTKIKENDVIAADTRFFKVDPFSGEIVYTQARNAMVAIMEGSYTEDDANLITETFSENLKMNFTKRKQIGIKATDSIISHKNIGDFVNLGDPIFVFDASGTLSEDAADETNAKDDDMFRELLEELDEDTIAEMIHQTPKANLSGVIRDIKVYWTCPINKMSKSVAKFVNEYISRIKKEIIDEEKFTGKPSVKRKLIEITAINKTVGEPRINGQVVDRDGGVVIEYYIGDNDIMSTGDKITLNSSLKTVTSYVVSKKDEPYTESGYKLDGIFSWISAQARMVSSWAMTGFLGNILYKYSKSVSGDFLAEIGEKIEETPRKIKL